jgi:hypothetical protein
MRHHSIPQFLLFIGFVYIVLSPFYVVESGLPQPADFLMMFGILAASSMMLVRNKLMFSKLSLSLMGFVGLVCAVNLYHFAFTPDKRFLLSSLAYIYNAGVFAFFMVLFRTAPEQTKRMLRYGLVISLVFQAIYLIFAGDSGSRNIGTFNNPNQLGYWALLIAASLYVLKEQTFKLNDYIWLGLCGFIGALSLSKAFLLVFPIILAVYIFSTRTKNIWRYLFVFFAGLVVVYSVVSPNNILQHYTTEAFSPVVNRLDTLGVERDDSLEGRGYLRIPANPEYLILGAGERAFDRFAPDYKYMELHAALPTILFSYGIIGLGYFIVFIASVLWRAPVSYWILMASIFSHGLVHQNIRFTGFWVFLAILYAMKKKYIRTS